MTDDIDILPPAFTLTRLVQKHARERGPEAAAFCRRELAAVEELSERVHQAHHLSRVSAGLLVSREELERLLLALASYHTNLESSIAELEKPKRDG